MHYKTEGKDVVLTDSGKVVFSLEQTQANELTRLLNLLVSTIALQEHRLDAWNKVFGHLGKTPDECGNALYRRGHSVNPDVGWIEWDPKPDSVCPVPGDVEVKLRNGDIILSRNVDLDWTIGISFSRMPIDSDIVAYRVLP